MADVHSSSNPLVNELRAHAPHVLQGGKTMRSAADEIERLTYNASQAEAEHRTLRARLAEANEVAHNHYQPQIDECIKDINLLRAALEQCNAAAKDLAEQRDKYMGYWSDLADRIDRAENELLEESCPEHPCVTRALEIMDGAPSTSKTSSHVSVESAETYPNADKVAFSRPGDGGKSSAVVDKCAGSAANTCGGTAAKTDAIDAVRSSQKVATSLGDETHKASAELKDRAADELGDIRPVTADLKRRIDEVLTPDETTSGLCSRHGQIIETGCPDCERALGRADNSTAE